MGLDQYLYKYKTKVNGPVEFNLLHGAAHLDESEIDAYGTYLKDNDKSAFVKSIFIESFVERFEEGDESAIETADKYIEDFKPKYDYLMAHPEVKNLQPIDIGYWRKHSDLQGYMEGIYESRGGDREFNLVPLYLDKQDCENVIKYAREQITSHAKGEDVEHTTGFFFGETRVSDWTETIDKFEEVIKNTDFDNEVVYYDSWW
jgi:hypothetical protein